MIYVPVATTITVELTEPTNVNIVVVKDTDGKYKPADAVEDVMFFTCLLDAEEPTFPNVFEEYGTKVAVTAMKGIEIQKVGCKDASVLAGDTLTLDTSNPGFLKKLTDSANEKPLAIALSAPVKDDSGAVVHEAVDIITLI